ncbi:hypothetical protein GQF03_14835 [Sneathiella chungangensis]|uniref:Uncharacterized protein n=1 Tax=Sneathiella chungangensis TaxID=1418234 RepID=A0A845MJ09_9PROT|nr:hypothetical protein [Sneathiella chungangensis]MZR23612.1 hypothetical protein [Sneathiella chungangensis]
MQGLQGLHFFFAAQGLQGLQAFLAAQGLQTFFAEHALHAFFGAQAATAPGTIAVAAIEAIAAAVNTSLNMNLSCFVLLTFQAMIACQEDAPFAGEFRINCDNERVIDFLHPKRERNLTTVRVRALKRLGV